MTENLDESLKDQEQKGIDSYEIDPDVALARAVMQRMDQQSHDAVTAVTSRDPALVSRERAAANALGTSRIEAENNLDTMEQAIKKNQAREQLKDSPSLTGYLAGHMADAPVLQNDLKAMSSIEQRLRAFGVEADEESGELELTTEAPDVWKMAAQDVAENASKGFKSGSAMTDLGMMWDKARTGRAVVDEEFTRKSKALEARMEPMNNNESWIAEAAQVVGQMARSVMYSANDTAAASGAIIGAGMASGWLAPEATVLGLAMVTGGTMEAMKSTEAGLAYKEMIDAGADPKVAAEAAEAVGVVNATLEVIGLGVFGKAFKPLISKAIERNTVATAKALANPSMLAMVKETFVGFGKGVAAEVSTEVMQEIVNIAGEQYTKEFAGADFDDMTADALYERLMEISEKTFKAMAVLGSAGATVTMAGGTRRVYKAREAQAYFEHLNEVMSTSESRQTTPDVTAEAVQQMADDASVPTVYIDAAEFRQVMQENGVTPEQLEQTLPGIAETLDSRADNHEDIEIPMGEYAAKIAGTDMGNALTIHARTNPDALSAKEEMLVRQESTKMIKGLMDGSVTDEDIDQNLGRFEGVSTEHIAELESQYRALRDQVEAAKGDEKKALQAQSKELRKTILAEKKAVTEQYKIEYDKLKDKYAADLKAADTNGVKTEDDIKREAKYGAWVSVNFARRAGLDPSRVAEVAPKIVSATSGTQTVDRQEGEDTLSQVRTKEAPKKTRKVYKLMRIKRDESGNVERDANGNPNLYALYIDANTPIHIGQWYDADSPDFSVIEDLEPGDWLVNIETGERTSFEDYRKKRVPELEAEHNREQDELEAEFNREQDQVEAEKKAENERRVAQGKKPLQIRRKKFKRKSFVAPKSASPNSADVNYATENGLRWMRVKVPDEKGQVTTAVKRYGVAKRFYNLGINGGDSVSEYALRPGWHAGTAPSMTQVGSGPDRNIRADDQVWVEGEVTMDVDYDSPEYDSIKTSEGDMVRMPVDGTYTFATNPKKAGGGLDWVISGAFRPVRILSDAEAAAEVERQNREETYVDKKTGETKQKSIIPDFLRAGGRVFNAETMELEGGDELEQKQVTIVPAEEWRALKRTVDNLTAEERAVFDEFVQSRPDADRIMANLEKLKDTPWAKQAVEAVFVRVAIRDLMAGREPRVMSMLSHPRAESLRRMLREGEEGLWERLIGTQFIGDAEKAVNNVNGSFINCDPSDDCAKFCYASGGHYKRWASVVKSELIAEAVESDPIRAAKITASQYKSKPEFYTNKALRLFDKGDGDESWIPFVEELNRQGVRVQVFSKRPEFLRRVSSANIRLLSIDASNIEKAYAYPDLPIAFVFSSEDQIETILDLHRQGRIQVVLPVIEGKSYLSKETVQKLRQKDETRTISNHLCPVNSGSVHIKDKDHPNGWVCTKCDMKKGVGCMFGQPTAEVLAAFEKAESELSDVSEMSTSELAEKIKGLKKELDNAIRDSMERDQRGAERAETKLGTVRSSDGGVRALVLSDELDYLLQELLSRVGSENQRDGAKRTVGATQELPRHVSQVSSGLGDDRYKDPSGRGRVRGRAVSIDSSGHGANAQAFASEDPEEQVLKQIVGTIGVLRLDSVRKGVSMYERLEQARILERNGATASVIWSETGWMRGHDGKWRTEIDDIELKAAKLDKNAVVLLGDVVANEGLFHAYPELKKVRVKSSDLATNIAAYCNYKTKTITVNHGWWEQVASETERRATLAHEIQHMIQAIEGFEGGASPSGIPLPSEAVQKVLQPFYRHIRGNTAWKTYAELEHKRALNNDIMFRAQADAELREILEQNESVVRLLAERASLLERVDVPLSVVEQSGVTIQKLSKNDRAWRNLDSLIDLKKYRANRYFKVSGEVEARNVEARLEDPEYRKRLISDTEDVPRSLQITMREAYLEMEKAFAQQAWHASRYRFKRFLSRAIGTGTGFQAHGYGLYFARKKSEAEGYIPVLTSDFGAEISVRGVEYVEDDGLGDTPSVIAAQAVGGQIERAMEDGINPAESFDRIIEGAVGDIDFMLNDGLLEEDQAAEIIAEIRQITIDDVSYADDDGVLYKVDIPEDNVLLNEDATFEQQPETVQAALRNAFDSLGIDQAELVGMTGEDLYHKLAKALGSDVNASLALNAEGIKGIKYGTEWNENFVIFDDKAINILDMMQEELKEFHDSVERANMQTTGSYSITHNVIKLTPNANLSTFAHEMGHWYLEAIFSVYGENGVSQLLREDVETILKDFGLDSIEAWYALPMKDREVLHERFAFYVEQYLAEGKAPTRQTRTLFERFAAWLKDVYKHFATPGEELDALYKERFGIDLPPMSEEVRRVLDRMVASEKSIEEAKAAAGLVLLFEQKPEGMSDEDWRELNTLRDEAEAEAAGKVFERRARDEKWYKNARSRKLRELQAQGKKIREQVAETIDMQLDERPEFRLAKWMKSNNVRMTADDLLDLGVSEKTVDVLRKGGFVIQPTKKNAEKYMILDIPTIREMSAFIHRYATPQKLVAALVFTCDRRGLVDKLTTEQCLRDHSDFFDQKKMDKVVTEALHTEARSRMLSTELSYLADNKNARSRVYREAAKQAAEALVAKMPIGKVSVKKFLNAQARASRAAAEALKRGDRMGAVMAKRAELVQHEAAMLAIDIEKKLAALKKLKSRVFSADKKLAATHDLDYVAVARSIMTNEGIGVGSPSTGTPSKAIKALERLKSYDPDKYAVMEPLMEGHGYRGDIDFGAFTVEYAMQVIDDVQQVMKLARDSKTLLLEGRRLNREDVLAELSERFVKVNRTKATGGKTRTMSYGEKFGLKLMSFKSMLTRVENWCIAMDGGVSGPFFNYIFLPVRNAVAKFRNTNMDMQDKLLAIVKPMQEKWNAVRDIEAPELGYTFATKQELIGAVAHCGNLSNKHKLLLGGRGEGHKWARLIERPDGTSFVDTSAWDAFFARCFAKGILTKEDMDTIQAIWDLLEETKPLAQSAFKQMYGTYFEEVEATPVVTPVGTYRGGYVPAVTDQSLVPEKARHDEAKRLTEQDFVSQMPVHKPGFSKSRVPNYTKPLALDIGLLCGHVQEVLKFAVIAPVAQEIGKIISHEDFVTMIEEVNPTWINDMLVPWLKRSYEQTVSDGKSNWFSAKLNDLRGIAGMNIMAGHIANALQQWTGLSIAATKVSPKYLAKAMAELAKGESSIEMMTQMSPVMRARIDDRAQEFQSQVEHIARTGESVKQAKGVINKALAADAALDPARDWVARHAYFLQTCMQAPIDAVVWIGAYKQATDAGRTESEAIAEADSIVSRTQSSFQPEDVAGVEVGGALYRSVLVFYNYFGMQLNLLGESWEVNKHKKQYGKFALDAVLIAAVPSILSAAIAGMVTGFDAGDDDEWDAYDALRLLIAEPFKNVVAMIPFGGTAINYGGSKLAQQDVAWAQFVWGDDPYAGRLFGAPVVDMLDGGVSAVGEWMKAAEGDDYNARRAVRGTLDLLSIVTRMPVGALKKPLGYSAGVASGDIQPDSSVEAVQGFLAGRDISK